MASETEMALALGLVALQVLTYMAIDRRTHAHALMVSTGFHRGASIPVWHRRGLLQLAWMGAVGMQLGYMLMAGIGWLMLGRSTSAEDLSLVANLMAFTSFGAVVAWTVAMPFFWYRRLTSLLRQSQEH